MLDNIGLTGHFSSDFSIQGTPSNPAIYANGALQNASLEISDIGLFLENINLELDASGDNSIYVLGSLNSGSGLLNLDGDIDLAGINSPTANFSFRGEDLQLVDSHELKAVGKVDLSTKIAPDRLDIRGDISVNRARLNFVLPESLILASSDVILEGEAVQAAAFQQILDINLDLGDDTHIEAQGFQSKLAGEIRVLQEANGIMPRTRPA